MMNKEIIKKENLKYVWLAIFVTMVCTIITCQGDSDGSSTMEVKETEPIQEVIEEKIEEVKVEVEAKIINNRDASWPNFDNCEYM